MRRYCDRHGALSREPPARRPRRHRCLAAGHDGAGRAACCGSKRRDWPRGATGVACRPARRTCPRPIAATRRGRSRTSGRPPLAARFLRRPRRRAGGRRRLIASGRPECCRSTSRRRYGVLRSAPRAACRRSTRSCPRRRASIARARGMTRCPAAARRRGGRGRPGGCSSVVPAGARRWCTC